MSRLRRYRTWRYLLLLFVLFGGASPAAAQWEMGRYSTLSRPTGPPLMRSGSVRSFDFVSGVGGVAFSEVVQVGPGLTGKALALRYDPNEPDGRRLILKVSGAVVQVDLADWLLIPIARYAHSPYNASVSLFGEGGTDDHYQVLYHPAFENELLGVRLFHADVLLMDLEETWQLPRQRGTLVLGIGEKAPERLDLKSASLINDSLAGRAFRSWVLTDEGEAMRADVVDGRLKLTGEPYYFFWNADLAPQTALLKKVEALESKVDRYNSLVDRHNDLLRQGRSAELPPVVKELTSLKPAVLEYQKLVKEIEALDPPVQESPATSLLKTHRDALRRFNPPVLEAASQTARFAAFFRWVKREHPKAWASFMAEIAKVRTSPRVETPTSWPRIGSVRAN